MQQHWRVAVVSLLLLGAAFVIVVDNVVPPISRPVHIAIDSLAFITLIAIVIRLNVSLARQARREGAEAQALAFQDDRRVLARELHDSIAQHLCYLHLKLDELSQDSACEEAPLVAAELEQMRQVANEAYEDIYSLMSSLRLGPSGDLADTVRVRALLAGQRAGFEAHVTSVGQPARLAACHQQEVMGIVREALANVGKHARATRADIEIRWTREALALAVRDNGQGFEAAAGEKPGHFGLDMMKERAAEMGGVLAIRSRRGEGTVVELSVPLSRVLEPAIGSPT